MKRKPLPFRYHDDGINPNGATIVLTEGDNGSQYICCKSADGAFINCYKIAIHHQDPWGPPLP